MLRIKVWVTAIFALLLGGFFTQGTEWEVRFVTAAILLVVGGFLTVIWREKV